MEFLIFLVIVGLLGAYAIYVYNQMVSSRNQVRNAFAQIDVQLQRRYELIPNLVEAAKRGIWSTSARPSPA